MQPCATSFYQLSRTFEWSVVVRGECQAWRQLQQTDSVLHIGQAVRRPLHRFHTPSHLQIQQTAASNTANTGVAPASFYPTDPTRGSTKQTLKLPAYSHCCSCVLWPPPLPLPVVKAHARLLPLPPTFMRQAQSTKGAMSARSWLTTSSVASFFSSRSRPTTSLHAAASQLHSAALGPYQNTAPSTHSTGL
jgi:hypothetical protein